MNNKQFKLSVQLLAVPSDYEQNEAIITTVDELHREIYLECLKHGTDIIPSTKIAPIIWELSCETALSPSDIFNLLPKFGNLLNLILRNT